MSGNLFNIEKKEYYIKLLVVLLSMLTPFILYFSQGYLPSISSYWRTPMQPLFILSNAATSYFLFENPKWKISASFLLLLTAFSVDSFHNAHNILAILFFVSNLFPLYQTHHFKFCFWFYLGSLALMPISLLLGEAVSVIFLSLYHGLVLNKIYGLRKNN